MRYVLHLMGLATRSVALVTCSPDCYQSEVESGSFMMGV